jgi:predicted ATP-dependent serine protease
MESTATTFFCNTCDDRMPTDTGICDTCDRHYRAIERAMDRQAQRIVRVCGCRRPLPADRTVCDACEPYCDH